MRQRLSTRSLRVLKLLIRVTEASTHSRTLVHKVAYNASQKALARLYPEIPFTDVHGNRFYLRPRDVIDRKLLLHGVWEPHVTASMKRYIKPGQVFYDIGANIGYNTLLASNLVGAGGQVIAFEPNPVIVSRLRRHIADNDARNATVIEACVTSGDESEVTLFLPPDELPNPGRSTMIEERGFRPVQCAAVRIDALVEAGEIPAPDVVKIDVEGLELEVLRSMRAMLARPDRDLIVLLEITRIEGEEDTTPFLAQHGFALVDTSPPYSFVRDGRRYAQHDAVFVKRATSSG